jgi:hypothetical protein
MKTLEMDWEDKIKFDLQETGCVDADCVHLPEKSPEV